MTAGGATVGNAAGAFARVVDVILQLKRPEGNTRPTLRVLSALSRFDETPDELVIELTDAGYVSHGDVAAVAKVEAEAKILELLPSHDGGALSLDEILGATDEISRSGAQRAIASLMAGGLIRQLGSGRRGDPKRFWSASGPRMISAHPTVRVRAESIGETSTGDGRELPVSAQTPALGGAETNRPIDLPSNVTRFEDRRAPWEEEPEVAPSDGDVGPDAALIADLAVGSAEPETCAEVGAGRTGRKSRASRRCSRRGRQSKLSGREPPTPLPEKRAD